MPETPDPFPMTPDEAPISPDAHKPCSVKGHPEYYRGRADGTINCEKCHPSGVRLRAIMAANAGKVHPTYYRTLAPSPAAKKRRDKMNAKLQWGDDNGD